MFFLAIVLCFAAMAAVVYVNGLCGQRISDLAHGVRVNLTEDSAIVPSRFRSTVPGSHWSRANRASFA